jgi:hypothetical protein
MRPIIVHHANCPDGFGAAWWLAKHLPTDWEPAELIAKAYDDSPLEPGDVEGRALFVVDFCWPDATLDRLAIVAERMVVLDHHQTAVGFAAGCSQLQHYTTIDEWEANGPYENFVIVVDENRSGVGLVADWVQRTSDVEPPEFLANLEDRDLWRFDLDDTPAVFAAVTSRPYTVEAWDEMAQMRHAALVIEGEAINRYRDRLVDQVAASWFSLRLGDMMIPCASSPYAIGSDVAGRLAENDANGIGAYVILHATEVQIGLRSRRNGPDVAEIAERYGGGGHFHASGLRLSYGKFRVGFGTVTP